MAVKRCTEAARPVWLPRMELATLASSSARPGPSFPAIRGAASACTLLVRGCPEGRLQALQIVAQALAGPPRLHPISVAASPPAGSRQHGAPGVRAGAQVRAIPRPHQQGLSPAALLLASRRSTSEVTAAGHLPARAPTELLRRSPGPSGSQQACWRARRPGLQAGSCVAIVGSAVSQGWRRPGLRPPGLLSSPPQPPSGVRRNSSHSSSAAREGQQQWLRTRPSQGRQAALLQEGDGGEGQERQNSGEREGADLEPDCSGWWPRTHLAAAVAAGPGGDLAVVLDGAEGGQVLVLLQPARARAPGIARPAHRRPAPRTW